VKTEELDRQGFRQTGKWTGETGFLRWNGREKEGERQVFSVE